MKKITSLLLVLAMIFSTGISTFATNDYTGGTDVSYIGQGTESYTITVPATLNPGQSGTVTLSGTWASNTTISVTADTTVTLTNSINATDQKVLNVAFAGITTAGDNTQARTYTENVAVATMPSDALFGTWSGKFYYNVELTQGDVGGFKFGQNYVRTYIADASLSDALPTSIVLNSDGSAYVKFGLESNNLPTGSINIVDNKIEADIDGLEFIISDNGLFVDAINIETQEKVATWTVESSLSSSVKFGEEYVVTYDGFNEGFYNTSWYFYADGSGIITDGEYVLPVESGKYQYVGNIIKADSQPENVKMIVSADGNTITQYVDDVEMVILEHKGSNTSFKFGEKYVLMYIQPELEAMASNIPVAITGYSNGSAQVVINGAIENLPSGSFVINGNNAILDGLGTDESLIISDDGNTVRFMVEGTEYARWNVSETPLKFGQKYVITTAKIDAVPGESFVFNEDGSAERYSSNGKLLIAFPTGTFIYNGIALQINPEIEGEDMGTMLIATDGSRITASIDGEVFLELTINGATSMNTPLKFGEKYIYSEFVEIPALVGIWTIYNEDGSYTANFGTGEAPVGTASYTDTEIIFADQENNGKYLISTDGNHIVWFKENEIKSVQVHNSVYDDTIVFKNAKYCNIEYDAITNPNSNYIKLTNNTLTLYYTSDDSIGMGPINIYYVGQDIYGVSDAGELMNLKIGSLSDDGKVFYLYNFFGDGSVLFTYEYLS